MSSGERATPLAASEVAFSLRRSARARHISIRISGEGGVRVVAPPGVSVVVIEQVIRAKGDWIKRTLASMEQAAPVLSTGHTLTILDIPYRLDIRLGEAQKARVVMEGGRLIVYVDREDSVRPLLREWLHALATRELPPRVEATAALHGFRYRQVQVRNQRSRWGSCSRRGNLSLNWRLVLLPGSVMHYLMVHELCHLRHMNHSDRFWREVERHDPAWREAERWLRRHGRTVAW